jgi:hypothetical protein
MLNDIFSYRLSVSTKAWLDNDIPVLPNKLRPKFIFGEHEDDSKIRRENAVRNFEVEIKLLKNKDYQAMFHKKLKCFEILNNSRNFASFRLIYVSTMTRLVMNTLVTSQYQPRLSNITKIFSRRISQSD